MRWGIVAVLLVWSVQALAQGGVWYHKQPGGPTDPVYLRGIRIMPSGETALVRVRPLTDPVDGSTSPEAPMGSGWYTAYIPNGQVGSYFYVWPEGASPYWGASSSAEDAGGWPPAPASGKGYYAIEVGYFGTVVPVYAWVRDGQWSTAAPPPPAEDPPVGPYEPPVGQGYGQLHVWVTQDGAPVAGANIAVTGTQVSSSTTLTNGSRTFLLKSGSYHVVVTVQNGSLARDCFLPRDGEVRLDFVFDADGSGTVAGGEVAGGGGWLAEVLRSLFIPSADAVDALKGDLASMVDWGPGSLIVQLQEVLATDADPTAGRIALPALEFTGGGGVSVTDAGAYPLPWEMLTETSQWGVIRALLGAAVWLGGAFLLVGVFMPRFVH